MLKVESQEYVIFDGACGFCNASALWIAKRDVSHHFLLVSNQSSFGQELLRKHDLKEVSPNSIILIQPNGLVFTKSKAIQNILQSIPGYSVLKMLFKITPLFLQNGVYDVIAYFRKTIPTGKTCEVPDEELRKRFKL